MVMLAHGMITTMVMLGGSTMSYDDEGTKSRFNAGVALTERIDALQRAINSAKFNPFMKNMETGTFNYENQITALDNMIAEGWGKFSMNEKKECLKFLNILNELNEFLPPLTMGKDGDYKIHLDNFKNFKSFFGYCERRIKEFYDMHNLNAPSTDEDDDYDY
jgi:hypothetical protein